MTTNDEPDFIKLLSAKEPDVKAIAPSLDRRPSAILRRGISTTGPADLKFQRI